MSEATSVQAPAPVVTAPKLVVKTESPDSAVKSWWAIKDALGALAADACQVNKEAKLREFKNLVAQVSSGNVRAAFEYADCTPSTFDRVIDTVKIESETRSLVFATVKNSSPIPPGVEIDKLDTEWRKDGFRFKYLVEKSDGEWKVSEVYDLSGVTKDDWRARYKEIARPSYPSYVPPYQ